MGLGKTYSTKYLLDSNNNRGAVGQVLSTTSTGIDWVNANTVPGAGLWIESGNNIYNSNSGNVGIGTTSPSRDFVVSNAGASGIEIQPNISAGSNEILSFNRSSSAYEVMRLNGGSFEFRIGGNEKMALSSAGALKLNTYTAGTLVSDASGNITVSSGGGAGGPYLPLTAGSTKPLTGSLVANTQLYVKGGANIPVTGGGTINAYSRTVSTNLFSALRVWENTSASNYWDIGATGAASTLLNFYHNAGTTPKISFTHTGGAVFTGNVGIGTTSPGSKLHIYGAGSSPNSQSDVMALIQNSTYNSGDTAGENKLMFGWSNHYAANIAAFKDGTVNRTGFKIYTEVGYNTPVLSTTFASNGNVGIGNNDPQFKLQVSGSVALDVMPTNQSEGIVRIGRYDANTSRYNDIKSFVSSTAASNYLKFSIHGGTGNATVDTLTLLGSGNAVFSGNVGIGTTGPNTALQVNQATTVPLLIHRPSNTNFDPHGIGFSTRNDAANGGLGDVRSGIFSDYNGDLFLAASQSSITSNPLASSRLFIEGSSGNVGIGVVNPDTSRLLVRGSTNDSASNIFQAANLGGASKYVIRADGDNKWYKGDNSLSMILTSTGEVGIGVTAPTQKLHVVGGLRVTGAYYDSSNDPGTPGQVLSSYASGTNWVGASGLPGGPYLPINNPTFTGTLRGPKLSIQNQINTTSSNLEINFENGDGTTTDYKDFYVRNGKNGVILNITGSSGKSFFSGNVGIGATNPAAKLNVVGTTGLPATSGTAFTGTMRLGVSGYGTVMDFGAVGPSTGTQWIQVTDASNQALHYPLLLQPNGGNVGIGTTSPSSKLQLKGDSTYLEVRAADNSQAVQLGTDGSGDGLLQLYSDAGAVKIKLYGEAASPSYINAGNVGIGTTLPSEKLDVRGVIESPYLEFKPYVFYDFNSNSVAQWGKNNATLSTPSKSITRFTTTGTDANINRNFDGTDINSPAIPGGQNQIIRIRYKWISGTASQGEIFYKTSGHDYDGGYYKTYTLNADGEFHTLVLDMSNLVAGGTDWIDNDITGIRFDFINTTPVVIDIDWISVGGNGWGTQYFENDVAFTNGSVGIGTASPGGKLEVLGTSLFRGGAVTIGDKGGSSSTSSYELFFKGQNSSGVLKTQASLNSSPYAANTDAGVLIFKTANTSSVLTERIRIDGVGNVGIGTNNPANKLEVKGAIGIQRPANTDTSNINMEGNFNFVAASGYSHRFEQAGTEVARILPSGNVGIGTTNPGSKLVVNTTNQSFSTANGNAVNIAFPGGPEAGNIGGGLVFSQYYFSGSTAVIRTGGIYGIKTGGGGSFGGGLAFYTQPESAADMVQRMVINDLGNVGIGSDDADSKLDIVGATNASNSSLLRVRTTDNPNNPHKVVGFYVNTNTERGFISVNQFATTYSTSSDYRLKENIVPIPNSIERLKQLKPYRFNFIQGDPNYVVDGFIAHEAAEVIPEAVTGEKDAVDENNNPSYQGIDQSKVVPLLTAALQQAIDKIEQLEIRIQTIENN
jgi:hypothetical protein